MTQLVLGAVGAVVGFYVGGPTGASYGWMAGVALGGAVDPQNTKTQGPRLNDLKVQASQYGGMRPVIYGAMRTNGNVIFCTPKREVATESTSSAGKGGPTVTNTSYSYNVDIAIALSANPIVGIRKIWNNGQLIYDMSSGASLATVMASSTNSAGFKVYLGSETQLPDPTLEADLGVGNVPGYRGTAYVVFTQMDCPNGQIPQLSFEVVANASVAPASLVYADLPKAGLLGVPKASGVWAVNPFTSPSSSPVTLCGPGFTSPAGAVNLAGAYPNVSKVCPVQGGADPLVMVATESNPVTWYGDVDFSVVNLRTGEVSSVFKYYIYAYADLLWPNFCAFDPATGKYAVISPNDTGLTRANTFTVLPDGTRSAILETLGVSLAFYNGIVYVPTARAGVAYLRRYSASTGLLIDEISSGLNLDPNALRVQADAAGVYVVEGDTFSYYKPNKGVWKIVGASWVPLTLAASWYDAHQTTRVVHVTDGYVVVGPSNDVGGISRFRAINFNSVAPAEPTLASIITDICARAGLPAGQLDASAITDTVTGYALTQVSPARANLLPVQQYGFIDGIESDGILKFTPRASRVSVATIGWDELGAEQAGTEPGDPMALQRVQDADLPRSVALNYLNTAADYQVGTETARRIVAGVANDLVSQFPLATSSARAAQAAEVQLYDAWNERNQRSIKVSRAWAFLDAGDVITVEYPQGSYSAKRIVKANDTGQLIELALVDSDAAIYAPTAQGATPPQAQAGVSLASPTALQLLDIPILRDADDNAGLYVAMAGYTTPWPGAVLYIGPDDAGLAPRGGVNLAAAIGSADSALGNWASLIMDQTNTVLVTMMGGATLASAARDAVLDTGANLAALGAPGRWEIIAFTTAALVAGAQYQLSGLLRGLYGTEAQAGTHQVGDKFVLLQTAGMLRPSFDLSELNQPRQYRAITTGQSINTAGSSTAANTGVGIKPYNPVNLRRSTNAGNDITLTWDRRTRSSVDFPANGVDVPLFESSEAYQIDVFSSNTFATVVRTIASSTPSCTYTAAQQTADGLTPGATVNVRAYQIGSAGRGYPLQGSI